MAWHLTTEETVLALALLASTLFTVLLISLPSRFETEQRTRTDGSKCKASVQIVVLGDIGRSPRMQYHAISIAKNGGHVEIIGILDSELHPEVLKQEAIRVLPIPPSPAILQTSNKLLVLLFAPLKAVWQALCLFYVLGYRCEPAQWLLIQNPPFIPTFAIVSLIAFLRRSKLVIDWHNFGYSLYALKFGAAHPLVRLHEWYEFRAAKSAHAHFTVTNVMARVLKERAGIIAHPLHDRPPSHFQPLTSEQQDAFLQSFPIVPRKHKSKDWRLVVSATSWTPDEDFSILLDALQAYSTQKSLRPDLPDIEAVITGKGPQKEHYRRQMHMLTSAGKLAGVRLHTAWLSSQDYASLLGSADLGVSLHTSSSGLDLPMKVVDMFGTGLPVAGWSKFEAWPELVTEGVNGQGFGSAGELADVLLDLFADRGQRLAALRRGASKECEHRWDSEWDSVAGRILNLTTTLKHFLSAADLECAVLS